jgi:cytochrome bd-type quinol oxidase subunit 2
MKIDYFSLFVLLCSITLFGLIIYRLADPNLTDEKKKQLSYGEIVLSFFSSLMFLFSMFYIIILLGHSLRFDNKRFFSSLKTTILAIFYIITSPFSLSIIHYCFQEKLGNNEKILSILQLFSTLFCVLFVFFPEIFIKKSNLLLQIISPYPST